MRSFGADIWMTVLRALMMGTFDVRGGHSFRAGVVALKHACGVNRASREASRSAMLAGMWALVACRIPSGVFQRTHLGMRLRVLRFARMVERSRCDRCDEGERAMVLRGMGPGGAALRLCGLCRRRSLVPLERIRPYLGATRLESIPCVWLLRGGGGGDKENVAPAPPAPWSRRSGVGEERFAHAPYALVEHVLAVLD